MLLSFCPPPSSLPAITFHSGVRHQTTPARSGVSVPTWHMDCHIRTQIRGTHVNTLQSYARSHAFTHTFWPSLLSWHIPFTELRSRPSGTLDHSPSRCGRSHYICSGFTPSLAKYKKCCVASASFFFMSLRAGCCHVQRGVDSPQSEGGRRITRCEEWLIGLYFCAPLLP